ncbi:MAG TPA: lysophospholipid acyltransferase family protein [Rhizomicrobium sp.]|nr:lysophospholipid acyltransferase family protein [Rhizomicrobium sp.]
MQTIRASAILATFLVVTVILMPVQGLGVVLDLGYARKLPHAYHRFVAGLFGIHIRVVGDPVRDRGVLLLANHTSWLDIVIFSAVMPLSFVAKSEVAAWPFFGWLARLQRTVFVARARRSETGQVRDVIRQRLVKGEALVLFPEGTSGDGNAVLSFKSALLGAAAGEEAVTVQPVSAAYTGLHGIPMGRENRPLFAWYGDMELVPHLWEALKAGPLDAVVEFHPPLAQADRKQLAQQAEKLVREGHVRALAGHSVT